jgi:hypothetical protein
MSTEIFKSFLLWLAAKVLYSLRTIISNDGLSLIWVKTLQSKHMEYTANSVSISEMYLQMGAN